MSKDDRKELFLCIDLKYNYLTIIKQEPTDKLISAYL